MRKILTFILVSIICSSSQCQPTIQRLDSLLQNALLQWDIPGMSVGIVKDGRVLLTKGYGTKEIRKNDPVDENTLFAIASNTKAFVASALAQLVESGKISWQDKVKDYLPEFELYDPYVTANTTIKDLLCHRVGLGTFSGDLLWYKSTLTPRDVISKLKYLQPAYDFRDGYGYSNLMFIVAGEVIEVASGQKWDTYMSEHFFLPLSMNRTITSTQELKSERNYASPHKPYENGQHPIPWVNWDNIGAAGGIISSARDMSQWLIMNLNQGVYDIDTVLSSHQLDILWTPHNNHLVSAAKRTQIPGHHFSGYGLGWNVGDYRSSLMISHSGGYDGMYSKVILIPDQQLGIVILTNTMKGVATPLGLDIVDLLLNAESLQWSDNLLKKNKAAHIQSDIIEGREHRRRKNIKPPLDLDHYTGTYHSELHGDVHILLEKNGFTMDFENAPALSATLTHWHYNIWKINWNETHAWFDFGTVQFLLDNNLKVEGLKFDVPNDDIFFDEMILKRMESIRID